MEIVPKDDAYDPNKSPAAVTELIEKDKIAGSIIQVGTPNVAATRALYEQSCTPQMFVGTGFPAWGDPAHHPWTVGGGALGYNTEAHMWGEFIDKKKPGAKVAELTYNNDFGKAYATEMQKVAKENGFTIVESKLHEGTATSLDNEIAAILAANPDVVLGETTGKFCPMLMAGLAAGGYKGITLISATCASVAQFWKPVDPAGNGMYIVGLQKDPSDPRFADDPAMKQYLEDVAKYGGGSDPEERLGDDRLQRRRPAGRRVAAGGQARRRSHPGQHHERGVVHRLRVAAGCRRQGPHRRHQGRLPA